MKQIRRHLTYANVMSSLAVFLILGGATAFAAVKKIGANEIKANSIKTGKIVKEAVTAGKIKNGAVIEGKIGDGAVTTNKLADNAVTAPKIAKDAVTTEKILNDAVTGEKVKESTLGQVPSAANAVNAVNAQRLGGKALNDLVMWAFVNGNGSLLRSSGGVTSSRVGTGSYNVNFPRNISACAGTASNSATNGATNPLPNEIALAVLDADTFRVQTGESADGSLVDDEFMIQVTC
ncbi:MAG TPA: hypothetical protein VHF50_08455 [Solirubrobacterales bacterium]|nr:hypothetical protein [Solirubrobacterales bacterium]